MFVVGTHWKHLPELLQMSTNNICKITIENFEKIWAYLSRKTSSLRDMTDILITAWCLYFTVRLVN